MIPKRIVRAVLERDNWTCQLAMVPECLVDATVADHRADRGHGGSKVLNDMACLVAACGICNGAKADAHSLQLIALRERGLDVLKAATNHATVARCRETPVQGLDGVWWWLTSDGRRVEVGAEPPF